MMEEDKTRPIFVVLTPVRNEAWILRAFLEATSLWADHIIIADQMSTDGSREIARSFPKVTLIDNDRQDMHQAATRRLLFDAAKKIPGDKVIFTLDADEFLAGDFVHSDDWKKIVGSEPDDAFCWRWMNLKKGDFTQYSTHRHYYWAVHEAPDVWEGEFPDNFIHEWRLPWPSQARTINLDELHSLHFARVNEARQRNKERFYQVSTLACKPSANPIKLFRQYHAEEDLAYFPIPENAYDFYKAHGIDLWGLVDLQDEGAYYTSEILRFFNGKGTKRFAMLDIWDRGWMEKNGVKDPRTGIHKLVQKYLFKTIGQEKRFLVRAIDKVLGSIFR